LAESPPSAKIAAMRNSLKTAETATDDLHIIIEDEGELSPKELAQERKARLEELQKLSWMTQSASQLTGRIPVSVFAMGDLVGNS
jgi:hypothetical protein